MKGVKSGGGQVVAIVDFLVWGICWRIDFRGSLG